MIATARTALFSVAFLGLLGSFAPPAHAASFPCDKAATPDEIAICRTPDLNDADVEMAVRYENLLALLPMGGAGALRDAQKAWLAQRKLCGGDVSCLRRSYATRIAALKAGFQDIASRGPY